MPSSPVGKRPRTAPVSNPDGDRAPTARPPATFDKEAIKQVILEQFQEAMEEGMPIQEQFQEAIQKTVRIMFNQEFARTPTARMPSEVSCQSLLTRPAEAPVAPAGERDATQAIHTHLWSAMEHVLGAFDQGRLQYHAKWKLEEGTPIYKEFLAWAKENTPWATSSDNAGNTAEEEAQKWVIADWDRKVKDGSITRKCQSLWAHYKTGMKTETKNFFQRNVPANITADDWFSEEHATYHAEFARHIFFGATVEKQSALLRRPCGWGGTNRYISFWNPAKVSDMQESPFPDSSSIIEHDEGGDNNSHVICSKTWTRLLMCHAYAYLSQLPVAQAPSPPQGRDGNTDEEVQNVRVSHAITQSTQDTRQKRNKSTQRYPSETIIEGAKPAQAFRFMVSGEYRSIGRLSCPDVNDALGGTHRNPNLLQNVNTDSPAS